MEKLDGRKVTIIAAVAVAVLVLVGLVVGIVLQGSQIAEMQRRLAETTATVEPTVSVEPTVVPPVVEPDVPDPVQPPPADPPVSTTVKIAALIDGEPTKSGGKWQVGIDEVTLLVGQAAADQAASEGKPVPPDPTGNPVFVYPRNDSSTVKYHQVAAATQVHTWTLFAESGGPPDTRVIPFAEFVERVYQVMGNAHLSEAVYWVTIKDGVVTKLEEDKRQFPQYMP
jgi:cytoskeletal protein RodZ